MRNDPDRARAVTSNEDPLADDESEERFDRNPLDVIRQRHRLAGSAGGTGRSSGSAFVDGAEAAFERLNEAYQLLSADEPVDWYDADALKERTRQLRSRITHVSELEHAVLEYRDALYQAGVLQRRIQRHEAVLHRRVEIERLRADGTLYREVRRSQNRPAHVEVDPTAWQTIKREALRQRVTVGALVGNLVVQFAEAASAPPHSSVHTAEHRFARLTVDDEH